MQTKKIIGIALCAALVGSMTVATSLSVAAGRDNIKADELADYTSKHTFGVVGSITGWGAIADVPMTDEDGDGIFTAQFKLDVTKDMLMGEAADHVEFKVRADGAWDDSWSIYEEEHDRNMNGQINCSMEAKEGDSFAMFVELDTTVSNDVKPGRYWTVSYGKIKDVAAMAADQLGDDLTEYYFFLNLGDWTKVGAYWWEPAKPADWPGIDATEIGDTNIWAVKPGDKEATKHIIFNNLVSDADFSAENPKCQTADIAVDGSQLGKVFVPSDLDNESEGVFKYQDGEWTDFEVAPAELPVVTYTAQTSEPDPVSDPSPVSEPDPVSEPTPIENYETVVGDYIFFDNSQTKWDVVYAYWWESAYARTYDLEGNDYGCVTKTNEDGTTGYEPVAFPGTKMTQIPNTDIWQARIPFGAQYIIFNSGKTDEQVLAGEDGFQTLDLKFDAKANAGQIYVIDASEGPEPEGGKWEHKQKYEEGEWKEYTGEFTSETIAAKTDVSPDPVSVPTSTPVVNPSNPTVPVATGDATMPIAVATVAVAALGVVFFASRKKKAE